MAQKIIIINHENKYEVLPCPNCWHEQTMIKYLYGIENLVYNLVLFVIYGAAVHLQNYFFSTCKTNILSKQTG